MVATCPHCGAIVPEDKMFLGKKVKQRIFEYITQHPQCTMQQIEHHTYANDPSGGPLSAAVSQHLIQMRPTLEAHGLKLVNGKGRGATYQIIKEQP